MTRYPFPILLVSVFAVSLVTAADSLESCFEGTAEQRQRLSGLQGTTSPPPLEVENWINAQPQTLEGLEGKIVVLDFWATWCGPCIRSIPHMNEMQKDYGPQGVVFIGVCHSRGAEKMADTVEQHGIQYPVAADVEGGTVAAYQANGFPDYYIIDRNGVLRVADCANSKVEDALKMLLEE